MGSQSKSQSESQKSLKIQTLRPPGAHFHPSVCVALLRVLLGGEGAYFALLYLNSGGKPQELIKRQLTDLQRYGKQCLRN